MACREYLFIKLMSNQRRAVYYMYTQGDRLSATDTLEGFVRLILVP